MYDDPSTAIKTLFLPLISAQLLIVVAVYLAIVRKRIASEYRLYILFLLCLACFLIGPILQRYVGKTSADFILYFRVSLLFTLGMPALWVANAQQCGNRMTRTQLFIPFLLGFIASLLFVLFLDIGKRHTLFPAHFAEKFPFTVDIHRARQVQVTASLILGTFPSLFFLYKAWASNRKPKILALIFGALFFCLLFTIGSYWHRVYLLYYAGSIVTSLCWVWAIFRDIGEMKDEAGVLIDELQFLVQSNTHDISPDLDKLLHNIQSLSGRDLGVFKLHVREILNRLTETRMEAGGNPQQLLAHKAQQTQAVETSENFEQINNVIREEAVKLSTLMTTTQNARAERFVEQTKFYINEHFRNELDIDELADDTGVSRSYLMRIFKKSEGKTINQYLTDTRIDSAKKLLSELSVTDTAFAVGFNNSNYFGAVFKKATGMTPSQFQLQIRADNRQ